MGILRKLFSSKKHGYTQIKISPLPDDLLEKLVVAGCTTPNQCYGNCLSAVTNYLLAEKYVLCFVEIEGGERLGHAVIKVKDRYYDPTLEPQGQMPAKYLLHTEFSKREVRDFVKERHKHVLPTENGMEIYPPALRLDGKIVCEKIDAS
jgi:hypothetical protein